MDTQTIQDSGSSKHKFELLSELTLAAGSKSKHPGKWFSPNGTHSSELRQLVSGLNREDFEELGVLAMTNHVIMRSFGALWEILVKASGNRRKADRVAVAIQKEQARINHALTFLERICEALEVGGCRPTVIKSLDHWPDLGSDLDLYVDAPSSDVIAIMRSNFRATIDKRSWGDRLRNKWNFVIPGLPELVEIHIGRLGQTGEQAALTRSLAERTRVFQVGTKLFRVPAPEDRIVISTLQRMYRHFYIRLCDIVDNARLVDSGAVDFAYLGSLGSETGLWEGIATYLTIVSDYVEAYRGHGLPLPAFVRDAARFGQEQIHFRRDFLRVPFLPHSVALYATELRKLLSNGDLRNTFRLSLLPCLATAAAIEEMTIGSGKGIW